MADDRPAFAYEVIPLDAEPADDRRERLLKSAESVAAHLVSSLGGDVKRTIPSLVLETRGEMSAVAWQVMSGYDGDAFMEIVVPATLASSDPDGVALVRFAEVITDGAADPVMVIHAIDRSAVDQPGVTLAAPLLAGEDGELLLGEFQVLAQGLDPSVAAAMRRSGG